MSTTVRTRKRRMMNQINVVPYIDVTLVLLVIFMVTAPMTNPGVIDLHKVGQGLKQTGVPIIVTVKKDGTSEVEGKKLHRDQLLFEIKKQLKNEPRAVVVAADKGVKYDEVIGVLSLLNQNKIEKVGLLALPSK